MEAGTKIANYEIIDHLGQGSAGAVYSARHINTRERVALKVLHQRFEADTETQQRFVREVLTLQKLDHPNIATFLGSGIDDGRIYFVMELVEGGSLKDLLKRRGTLSWQDATRLGINVCNALEHAHANNVIHRDIKPGNLFLSEAGEVRVGDFGLARDLDRGGLTKEGHTVGTCRFMAPEQIRNEEQPTGSMDLYALGCIMFHCVIGRPPFDGKTLAEVFKQHINATPARVDKLAVSIPKNFADLIDQLLRKHPEDRPEDAARTRELLELVLAGKPLPRHGQAASNKWAWIGGVAVAAIVIALAVYFGLR